MERLIGADKNLTKDIGLIILFHTFKTLKTEWDKGTLFCKNNVTFFSLINVTVVHGASLSL